MADSEGPLCNIFPAVYLTGQIKRNQSMTIIKTAIPYYGSLTYEGKGFERIFFLLEYDDRNGEYECHECGYGGGYVPDEDRLDELLRS